MRAFQMVEVSPSAPFDMGVQYGRQAREKILAGIEGYKRLFLETSGMPWGEISNYAREFIPGAEETMPDVMAEVRGIAEGAGASEGDLMALNCRYEITKFPRPEECTSFALLSETLRDGGPLVGQNWDYRAGIIENIVIIHARCSDGTRVLGLAEAGQVIRNGFNSHGIGLCANNLQSVCDRRGVGIPVTFLRRRILSCRTFDEAIGVVKNSRREVSCNLMIASSDGRAADLETYPGGFDLIEPEGGMITHANHFVANPKNEALETSPRGDRLRGLFEEKSGDIDVPYVIRSLCDHENYPKAICRHPSDVGMPLERRGITVAGVVYDLGKGIARICAGPSCEGEFVEYRL
ncbi:MAG: C45 family peptidase [Synergistaceae bacterium]|jgi:isopenicillin-N N-acyltransferase-like protein|nr:C45 family peptidase [Synergistaceae bacterium]